MLLRERASHSVSKHETSRLHKTMGDVAVTISIFDIQSGSWSDLVCTLLDTQAQQ